MGSTLRRYLRKEHRAASSPFCPGCGNGILRGLILEAIEGAELKLSDMLFVGGIGCTGSSLSSTFDGDVLHTLHGRAIAFATGAKLANPRLTTMVISGDGDLADIGGNHLIHAARRNLDIKVILSNNMCYGMTGGQVCSTTPYKAFTMTTTVGNPYRPFNLTQLVMAAGATYAARYAVTQPFLLMNSIKKCLQTPGFCFVEALTACPIQFGKRNEHPKPQDMLQFLMEQCVTIEQTKRLSEHDLQGKFITGEFTDGKE